MTAHANIPTETLVELVEQLPAEQQQDLLRRLRVRARSRSLTEAEKMALQRTVQVEAQVNREPSP